MKLVPLAAMAAFAIASTVPAVAADTATSNPAAKTSNKVRSSDDLNRQQVSQYNQFLGARTGTAVTGQPQVGYADTDASASEAPTNVLVVGPAHDATETQREPSTSPPSSGQPAVDQPYVAVQPGQ